MQKGAKDPRGSHAATALPAHGVFTSLGLACLIVGIVGEAANRDVGLEPTSWLLIAIAVLIFSVIPTIMSLWEITKEREHTAGEE